MDKHLLGIPPILREGESISTHCLQACQGIAMREEIERLRKALQLIAAPSKVVVKGEEAVVALRLVLSSHRRTALKALGGGD